MPNVVVVSQSATTVPGSGSPGGVSSTFGTFIRDIAVYYGLDQDPEKEAWIGRIIHDLIDDLNSKKLWRFNLIVAADFPTAAGDGTYDLATIAPNLWRIYSVRKSDDIDYMLTGLRQNTFDTIFQSQNQITGYPYVYTSFNIYRDGTLKIFPVPDGVHTMTLRYYRLIAKPAGLDERFDLPAPFQTAIKYGTLARVGAMCEKAQSTSYWESKFQEKYVDANRMDEFEDDENLRFTNIEEMASRAGSFMNPALRPRYLDFY